MKLLRSIVLFFVLVPAVLAQQTPHLAYVYPAGGKVGATVSVAVGGQFLLNVSNAFVTGPGISATVLDRSRPMPQKDFNELRDRLKTLREQFQSFRNSGTNAWTAADTAEMEQIRAKILRNPPNRTANPAMLDTVTLRIAIATNAPPGDREIRLATPLGLSNPFRFCVGTLPEFAKPAARTENPDLDKFLATLGGKPAPAGTPKYSVHLNLPVVINGQIMPGGVDSYRFSAACGQSLVLAASARALIPYIADAVPGWFEAVLTIYDSSGHEVAAAERFHLHPDPVLHFVAPKEGEYTVTVHDSIFRGREDFVYRLAIGELPFVTGIFPLGGRRGETTTVALTGWNLSETLLSHANPEAGLTTLTGNFFNAVPFMVDDFPECLARAGNDPSSPAQAVTLPVIINGCVSRPGEDDVYQFAGHAGQAIVAEVFARRLDSPLDSFLRLTDATGKTLAFNDDFDDRGSALNTHQADSYLSATLPADGTYYIHLTDTQGKSGPDFAYRLRLSEPQPDFALRLAPSSLSVRPGLSAPVTVWALRRDGFTNAISLDLPDAPPGFSLSGANIAAGQDQAKFTLRAPQQPLPEPISLAVEGRALIGGQWVSHRAVPAENLEQAFMYWHLVPSQELAVAVTGPARPFLRNAFKISSATPVRIPAGGTGRVRVSAPAGAFLERFQLELDHAPEGISLTNVSATPDGLELVFAGDAAKVKPGDSGNLICDIVAKTPASGSQQKKFANAAPKGSGSSLPAIPFLVTVE